MDRAFDHAHISASRIEFDEKRFAFFRTYDVGLRVYVRACVDRRSYAREIHVDVATSRRRIYDASS